MTLPLRILILDNNPDDVTAVINALKDCEREFSAIVAVNEPEFSAALRDQALDLVLAERFVGSYDGFSALATLKKFLPQIPFLFVTHVTGEESAIDALHHGAADWVSKRKLERLDSAISGALSKIRATTPVSEDGRDVSYYRTAFEHCPDGMVILDPESARPIEFNPAAHQNLGYSREEFARLSLVEINAAESPVRIREMIEMVRKSRRGDFETRHRTKDGKIRDVHVTTQNMRSGEREVFLCVWRDITARKQAEQRISELNLVLRASSAINALMVRERDPQRLLNEACKILVETRGYPLAWIGLTDSGPDDLKVAAHAGNVPLRADGNPADMSPMRQAVASHLPEICADFGSVSEPTAWHSEALTRGIASMAVVPIVHGSQTLGAVAVYSQRAGAFHPGELSLLKELATDLAFALQSIEDGKERTHAEAQLRESERRYRLLFNSGYDAVFVHQASNGGMEPGKFIEVNDIACQRLGYTRKELLQMTPADICAPETLADIPSIRTALATEQSAVSEGVHLTKDGRRVPVEISTHAFQLNGKTTRLSTVRDVTERKRAESRLHLLSEALESAANAIVITDREGRVIWVNAAFTHLTGYPIEDVLGQKPNILKSGIHNQEFYRGLWSTVLSGRVWSAEMTNRRKDGSLYTEENTITPVRNESGEITHFIAVKQDVTERKRAEAELRESESRFRQMAETIESVFWMCNARLDKVLYLSPAYDRIWGRPHTELYDAPGAHLEAIHPDDRARVIAAGVEMRTTDPAGRIIEYRIRRPDKSLRWIRDRAFAVKDHAGQIERLVGISEDITDEKHAELRISAFSRLGQRLSTAKTAREAATIIVDVADHLLGWDACFFDLYSEATQTRAHLLGIDLIDGCRAECPFEYVQEPLTALTRRAINEGGVLILRDHPSALRDDGLPFGDKGRPSASIAVVPVRNGRSVVGILSIQSYTSDAYNHYTLETLQALADHAGGALERIRAQEALAESETRFRSVWANSTDGMRLTDSEGAILDVNEAFCRLVKLPREKLLGNVFSVAYHGHGPNDGIDVYQQRFASGTITPIITARTRLWDATEIDLEITSSFIEIGRQRKMLFSIFRDVSDRFRNQQRIEAFANLGRGLSAARSAMGAATIITEIADRLLGWEACTLDLYTPEDDKLHHLLAYDTIDGKRTQTNAAYTDMAPTPLARRVIKEGGQLILRKDSNKPLEGSLPFGDISRTSASILMVPIRNGSDVAGVMSIHSYKPDAYDERSLETLQALADHCGAALVRIHVQEAWHLAEQRLRHLITQSPAVIYSLKTDGKKFEHAWISDNVKLLLGYDATEAHHTHGLFDRLHPHDRQTLTDGLKDLVARKHIARDFRVRHKSGNYRWVRDEQRLVCDPDGTPVEIVGSWTDITERKALEEELRQAQKMEAVGRLAGGVAHDFNNLLAVIRGNADLLLMDKSLFNQETVEGLKHVVEAAERAASLTRQLLAFSRKQVLQPQALHLNQVIANLTKMLKRVIGENIDLQCQYAEPLPHIHADLGMMEQVILNLVVNARDAMPQGGKLLVQTEFRHLDADYARTHPEGRAGAFVCITVRDTGSGIAPEVLPRIFEPFFTTKEVGKGTGLGLATVYGIVQQHQGWVEVCSQVGLGTAFCVFLPAMPAAPEEVAKPVLEQPARGGNETILLVEDDQAVRMTTRKVLESKGYKVLEATTARGALKLWKERAEDVSMLLSDIIMPEEMTGRELAECLWREKPNLKVVFISGYSADVVGKNTDFIRKTGSYFLQKPFSSRALLEIIRRCLDEGTLPSHPPEGGRR